ncbi:MAG TPA: N-acetylmuramic acid 6-phosphate etherase [Acidimicrobiales bacterium]|nr:N-acetylmuramic acid 6-phosphate etherase [Acidimicrobiales bacterium]
METNDTEFLEQLGTEQVRHELSDLDQLSIDELVDVMCADVRQLPHALVSAQQQIVDAVTDVVERLERGGRLIYVGAGTAGRLGMLDAAEAGPTFNVAEGQVVGVLAGGTSAFEVPVENAEDDFRGGQEAVRALNIDERDCVVGISASGRTPYVLGAIEGAIAAGALTVGIACNRGTPLAKNVDRPIEVVVGPELIAGSTRMNSGTVQKIVLNVISTASMVRLGKTYGNLMVDLRPTNEKLRDRSARIVARITDVSIDDAGRALEESGWKTKVAATMIVGHVDASAARERLALYEGRLRPTLDSYRAKPNTTSSTSSGPSGWTRLGVARAFVDGALVTGDVAVSDGSIVAVGLSHPGTGTAIAGLIDAQVNGYAGVDLLNASVDEILEMGEALLRDGVIAYQPTLITSDFDDTRRATQRLKTARDSGAPGARILGVHLEGPFLSRQRSGTHPVEHLREPDLAVLDQLLALDNVSMMTIAPELPGALALIERCVARGIIVSLGHSAANADEAALGFAAGARAVTHLFNSMEPLSARSPGLAGAALARKDVTVQFIGDGVHVADDMITVTFAAATDRCIVVSDAIAAAACDASTVQLGDVAVHVRDGVARRDDGTIAGSVGTLRDSLARIARLGVGKSTALAATVSRPARLLGIADSVSLAPGTDAHFFVLNDKFEFARRVTPNEIIDL